jgi:transcriptional regulator with XRE-family HTH domain
MSSQCQDKYNRNSWTVFKLIHNLARNLFMMNQPELGKKIAELRKVKGLTQEELVEKCNISVRTLQRIESGEVMPRSYTVKTIFAALDYIGSSEMNNGFSFSKWLGQLYKYVFDLFNLKTKTMKKVTILVLTFSAILLGLFLINTESKAQKAVKAIEYKQKKWNDWLAKGQIDSVMNNIYRDDACVMPTMCGKIEIREMVQSALDGNYKLIDFKNLSISVADSIAVQKSYNVYEFQGVLYKQKSMTEWRLTKGDWLVVNDIMVNY